MQYKMFSIPAFGEDTNAVQDELNSFLRGHRVISVDKQLVSNPEPVWCFCIEYIQGNNGNPLNSGFAGKKEKTDYRQILKGAEFDRFQKLRECRKIIAQEEAVPAYAIFLDDQLAELSKHETIDIALIRSIPGIGDKKTEKYGQKLNEQILLKNYCLVKSLCYNSKEIKFE